MKVNVPPGKYVLAVSGGVDSMVLLDVLVKMNNIELVVAHFNHGIRPESDIDEALVNETVKEYGLIYEAGLANLGPDVSEEAARRARYEFLETLVAKHRADMIITAHHQDDWIETALINIVRGTGRQGVSAILNNKKILRPLINVSKMELLKHARLSNLKWNDDSTNMNQNYLRNYLRNTVLIKLTPLQRKDLLKNLDKVAKTNAKLDKELATLSHKNNKKLDRQTFTNLPMDVGRELIVFLLRRLDVKDYDRGTVNRLSLAIKTAKPNSVHPIKAETYLNIKTKSATFVTP